MDIRDLDTYDYIIVAFSGGKDSQAAFLHLLDLGVPKEKIELWHHIIDGKEGSTLMDWKCTEDYCRKFAEAFEVPIYFSWKEGGFEREMLRSNQQTAPNHFEYPANYQQKDIIESIEALELSKEFSENPKEVEDAIEVLSILSENPEDNIIECGIGKTIARPKKTACSVCGQIGCVGCRQKFPQVSADLSVRWCSAYLKIDVCTAAINNQERFLNKRTLVITGERAEESPSRAKYNTFEPDKADNRNGKRIVRHVDHWRPVHSWLEQKVWDIIEKYKVLAHPAYRLGWGRLSCIACIFGSKNQFASLNKLDKGQADTIIDYEKEFGVTIKRKDSVEQLIIDGTPYDMDPEIMKLGLSEEYYAPIFVNDWTLPKGAFGENVGPS